MNTLSQVLHKDYLTSHVEKSYHIDSLLVFLEGNVSVSRIKGRTLVGGEGQKGPLKTEGHPQRTTASFSGLR